MGNSVSQQSNITLAHNENFVSMIAKPEQDVTIARVMVTSSQELLTWGSKLIKVIQLKPPYLLLPREYKTLKETICGGSTIVEIEFECFYIQLAEEIIKRKNEEKYLEEVELWYLILCLVGSARFCHQLGSKIGDVKPSNILLNRKGNIKILNKYSVPSLIDPYQDNDSRTALFSPEQLSSLKKAYKQNPNKYILSESFSIGMTVLSAGTLNNLCSIYKYENHEINMIQYNRFIKFWQEFEFYSDSKKRNVKYSESLKNLVLNLIQLNPDQRMTSLQVQELLRPHISKIMELSPFDIVIPRCGNLHKNQPEQTFTSRQRSSSERESIHHLRSRKSSLYNPLSKQKHGIEQNNISMNATFNQDISFSYQVPSIYSEVYNSGSKRKEKSLLNTPEGTSRKLSTTAKLLEKFRQEDIHNS